MRVLINAVSRGGIGRYGLMLGHALSCRSDVCVRLLVSDEVADSPVFGPLCERVGAHRIPLDSGIGKLNSLRRIYGEISQFRPEILHDTSGSSGPLAPFVWSLPRSKLRLVITEHDVLPHSAMGETLLKRFARRQVRRRPHHVIVHGERSRRQFREGVNRLSHGQQISVIPHGELGVFGRSSKTRRESSTVLFFGALRPNKGVAWLTQVADLLKGKHHNLRILVAGSSRLSREFEGTDWADQLDTILAEMRKRPEFELQEGFVPDEEVGDLFGRATVCLLPYRDATASGVAAMAMPLGSVVVGTRVGDLPEQLVEGKAGLVVDASPASIAEGVDRLLSSPAETAELRHYAQEHARERLSWSRIADLHLDCYRSTLGASS